MTERKKLKTEATPAIGDRLLTLREAADVLRLNPRTVRDYVQRGEIEGRIIGGREIGAKLTLRQVAFAEYLMRGTTITEAARRAGYSKKCPGQAGYQALQNLKLKMPELLDRLGLSDVALIEKHLKPLLSARTTKFFQHRGRVTGKRIVADNDARLRALDMVLRLRGSFALADPKLVEPTGVKVIIMDAPRPPRTLPIATSPQLPSLRDR